MKIDLVQVRVFAFRALERVARGLANERQFHESFLPAATKHPGAVLLVDGKLDARLAVKAAAASVIECIVNHSFALRTFWDASVHGQLSVLVGIVLLTYGQAAGTMSSSLVSSR